VVGIADSSFMIARTSGAMITEELLTREGTAASRSRRSRMIQTLIKNWWLLALCGILDATYSAGNLFMQDADGSLTLRTYALKSTVVLLGKLALAAGACTIAAGLWRSTLGKSWFLVLNGLALGALGLIFNGIFGFRISLRTIALLMVVMAMSIGIFELVIARALRRQRHVADEWLLGLAGAASVGFALAFLAFGFHWIELEPRSHADFLWFGSYFGFNAICMLGLALRLHRLGLSPSGQWEDSPALGNPRLAH
jgi:uncharacterized membrane protein HdeD (DUF308 family)